MSWLANAHKLIRYDDSHFFYIWKPHDIPSVRGFRFSMFELLEEYIQTHDDELTTRLYQNQHMFGLDSEWWLCNRLDVPTAWLLYFAKSANAFMTYHQAQKNGKLIKHYTWSIVGHIKMDTIIARDIAHHPHLPEKMVVKHTKKTTAHRGKRQQWRTQLQPLVYDNKDNQTHVLITIHGGVRHQIRTHCASIGSPLVGETLYGTKHNRKHTDYLQLFCVGHTMLS